MERHRILFAALFALILTVISSGSIYAQSGMQVDPVPAWIDPYSRNSLSSAWGDLDNDGDLDLVVGTLDQGIRVWTNVDGDFPPVLDIGGESVSNPTILARGIALPEYGNEAVAIGDLNGDGLLDLVVANGRTSFFTREQPNQVYINRTKPDGPITLQPVDVEWNGWPAGSFQEAATSDVALADIDRDGKLDIAFADRGWVRVYLNATGSDDDGIVMNMLGHDAACPADPLQFRLIDRLALDSFAAIDLMLMLDSATIVDTSTVFKKITQLVEGGGLDGSESIQAVFDLLDETERAHLRALVRDYLVGTFFKDEDTILGLATTDLFDIIRELTLLDALGQTGDVLRGLSARDALDQRSGRELIAMLSNEDAVALVNMLEQFEYIPRIDALLLDFGDVNGDGLPDLAAATADINWNDFGLVWENEHGCLGLGGGPVPFEITGRPSDLAFGDLNNDGNDEIALTARGFNTILGNENGQLTEPIWSTDGHGFELSVGVDWGDVDGDGDLDLAIAKQEPNTNAIYLNNYRDNPERPFENEPAWSDPLAHLSSDVRFGDIDGDGDLDLATTIYAAPDLVYRNLNPSVSTTALPIVPTVVQSDGAELSLNELTASSLAWGDVDNDGDLDLAVGFAGWGRRLNAPQNISFDQFQPVPSIVLKNVDGALESDPMWQTANAGSATSVAWGDMDADGDLDLAIGHSTGAVEIYLNDPAESLDANAGCRLQVNDGSLHDKMLHDPRIGLLAALRADPGLLAQVRADDDLLGRLINQIAGADEPLAEALTDEALVDVARADDAVMRKVLIELFVSWGYDREGAISDADNYDLSFYVPIYLNNDKLLLDKLLAALLADDDLVGLPLPSLAASDLDNLSQIGYVADIAWGDVNRDGFLDLAVAVNRGINQLFLFDQEQGCPILSEWLPVTASKQDPKLSSLQHSHQSSAYAVAFGDVDGDGDVDLAVGSDDQNVHDYVYLNQNGMLDDFPAYSIGVAPRATRSLAWGDVDGDGDLDLATGVWSGTKTVYENVDGFLLPDPLWESADTDLNTSLAWGDADGDGDLDLAAGNVTLFTGGASNDIYTNRDGVLDAVAAWMVAPDDVSNTNDVAWADMNGDGLLDLAAANQNKPLEIHLGQRPRPSTGSSSGLKVVIYAPEGNDNHPDGEASTLAPADFYAVTQIQASGVISIPYWLVDPAERPVARIQVSYALSGTKWIPAVAVSGTVTSNLKTVASLQGVEPYVYYWDTTDLSGQGFIGQSDTVVVRIQAFPDLAAQKSEIAGSYQRGFATAQSLPFRAAGHQILVTGAEGPVEGAMVMRRAAGAEKAELIASRTGAPLLTGSDGILQGLGSLRKGDQLLALAPVTNTHAFALYYTSGKPTEQSYALQRVAAPGVQTLVVTETSPLVVYDLDISLEWDARNDAEFLANFDNAIKRASNVLFDLTNGQALLGNVRLFLNRENWVFSDVVVYASNSIHPRASMGGVVLDAVDDVDKDGNVIENAYLPGQIHMGPFWDPFGQSQQELQQDWWRAFAHELGHYLLFLPDNYLGVEETLDEEGNVVKRVFRTTNCVGSFMTNAYDENIYGEFLIADDPNWTGETEGSECQDTVAVKLLTGRSDWETITAKLNWNMLNAADDDQGGDNQGGADEGKPMIIAPSVEQLRNKTGPHINPLDITRVIRMPMISSDNDGSDVIPPDYYDIRDENNTLTKVRQAQAYLYHVESSIGENNEKIDNLSIIALGSTGRGADRIRVRGAEKGDRLCIFDSQHEPPRAGCVESLNADTQTVNLNLVDSWSPAITVTPVSSRTMIITVSHEITGVDAAKLGDFTESAAQPDGATARSLINKLDRSALRVQAIPAYGDWRSSHNVVSTSPALMDLQAYAIENTDAISASLKTVTLTWTKVVTIAYPSFEGFVRVWEPDEQVGQDGQSMGLLLFPGATLRESLTQYYLSAGWGPNDRGWDGGTNTRVWGPNDRGWDGGVNQRYWGPNDRGWDGGTNTRTWGPNDRGWDGGTNTRIWGPNDRGWDGGTNTRTWGPNDRGWDGGVNARAWGSNNRTMEAPIASGDGRITVFNVDDILVDPGATALQAVTAPPNLAPWMTAVGKAYRFTSESASTNPPQLTISFHYLARDVPAGYSHALSIYYQPLDSDDWVRLPTELYANENMAVAAMPNAQDGIYALIATVELPVLLPGWNTIAYTVPQARGVADALSSLDGQYSAVYAYSPEEIPSWNIFAPLMAGSSPSVPLAANSLSQLEYGHAYLIHITATHPVTPYLAVPDVVQIEGADEQLPATNILNATGSGINLGAVVSNDLAIAPAVLAGEIAYGGQPTDVEGKQITAVIVDPQGRVTEICGSGDIKYVPDGIGLYYVLPVRSASQQNGCGVDGSTVELMFGKDTRLADDIAWNNRTITLQSLVVE